MKLQILLVLLVCICSAEAYGRGRSNRNRFRGFFGRFPQSFSYTIQIRNALATVTPTFDTTVTVTQPGSLLGALVNVANLNSLFLFAVDYTPAAGFRVIKLNNLENDAAGTNNWVLTRNGNVVTTGIQSLFPVNGDAFIFDFVPV